MPKEEIDIMRYQFVFVNETYSFIFFHVFGYMETIVYGKYFSSPVMSFHDYINN